MASSIVQYIVIRGDLAWPVGALIAQGAHCAVAAVIKSLESDATKSYVGDLPNMHKVILKANNEAELKSLVANLEGDKIAHYPWIEQPEDLLVAVASAPNEKAKLSPYFKQFKLFK